ncbi:hypothetical protein SAMN04489713_10866 [Actinomadura madurae]|uniref:CU044_5270 family protein n=1 Tax=Actinomadura madurae TaxID=1993 RepID=A0A1I5IU09_9ACTN|nr:CU044_5270 family protein [Actinomadura madurae]SFO63987.1 hypothetical protein SAMN04489713_10866 [Actinomadura madurae]
MNDLDILRDAWAEPGPPAEASRTAARTALLERASGGTRKRGRFRLGIRVAVVAAAVAVGVTVVQAGDEDGPVVRPVSNASQALERAALAAEARPFTPPRPDQWVYIESRTLTGPVGAPPENLRDTGVRRQWKRADGTKSARLEDGKLVVSATPPTTPPSDYASLAALPTDPAALLQWVYQRAGGRTAEGRYSAAYSMLCAILRDNLLPPKTEAAVYRAITRIPGVTAVLFLGLKMEGRSPERPVLGLGRVTEGRHRELLLDRNGYAYLGEGSAAIEGDALNLTVRVRSGVVDEAGQRP